MNSSSLAIMTIALAASGSAAGEERFHGETVAQVVAAIRADPGSEFDCFGDDDSQRFSVPPAPAAARPQSAADLAQATRENRARLARVERLLRAPQAPR